MHERPPAEKHEQRKDIAAPVEHMLVGSGFVFWPHDLNIVGEKIQARLRKKLWSEENAEELELKLKSSGHDPIKEGREVALEETWLRKEVIKAAANKEALSADFFNQILEFLRYREREENKVESPEEFAHERKDTLEMLWDYSNMFYKSGYDIPERERRTKQNLAEFWKRIERDPLPRIEEAYSDIRHQITFVPRLLKYCKEVVDQINVQVDIMNSTRDPLIYERGVNKILYILSPSQGTNKRYKEPDASAEYSEIGEMLVAKKDHKKKRKKIIF